MLHAVTEADYPEQKVENNIQEYFVFLSYMQNSDQNDFFEIKLGLVKQDQRSATGLDPP